jgi:CubicO group peptidase (beta-lactamase class C family)
MRSFSVREAETMMQALETFRQHLIETNSSAGIVLQNGKPILEHGDVQQPTYLASVGKVIVAMAVFRAIHDQCLNLDDPVHRYFPEWNQGRKKRITVRHLLGHVSGLQTVAFTPAELAPAPDHLQLSLCAELEHDPGTVFTYNNKGYVILAALLERATRAPFEHSLRERLWIKNQFNCLRDSAGNLEGHGVLELSASSLARLGYMIYAGLHLEQKMDGELFCKSLVDQEMFQPMLELPVEPYRGYSFFPFEDEAKTVRGWYMEGDGAQWLFVIPEMDLVVVRFSRDKLAATNFHPMVQELTRAFKISI